MAQFSAPLWEKVVYGQGAIDQLPAELERLGAHRVLVVTGPTVASTEAARRVVELAGSRLADVYDDSRPHVPTEVADAAVTRAREVGADLVLSLGGGSPIDLGKLVTLALIEDGNSDVPHVSVSTTLSAGEFTPAAGVTDPGRGVKDVRFHPRIGPRVVFLDPELTIETPLDLWTSTGIKALDHAVEGLEARRPQAMTDLLAKQAISLLLDALPRSCERSALAARADCQLAAWLSIFGVLNVGVRLSHALGHQLGARFGIPHGITSCITLAPTMRLLAPTLGHDRRAALTEVLGDDPSGRVAALVSSLKLPSRLRDVGVERSEAASVAPAVLAETSHDPVPGGEEALLRLLDDLW